MIVTKMLPPGHLMRDLARTFPSMRERIPGIDPWDPCAPDAWAYGPTSHGELYTARFLLAVWHGRSGIIGRPRRTKDDRLSFPVVSYFLCGPFDVVDALSTWDAAHRAAFLAWAKDPWWP